MLCFRFLQENEPATALAKAVTSLNTGEFTEAIYEVDPSSFRQIPNAPFAYWVSERVRRIFTELPAFESEETTVKQGLATADDFRFVRTAWEAPSKAQDANHRTWFPFAKGGSYSPFYSDVFLKVNWGVSGAEMNAFHGSVLRNTSFYLRPGLTWPRRTNGLSFRVLPTGCVFADKGPAAFSQTNSRSELLTLAALTNSRAFEILVSTQLARVELAQSFEVGLIQSTPIPQSNSPRLSELAFQAWAAKRRPDTTTLTSHAFVAPALSRGIGSIAKGIAQWLALIADCDATVAKAQAEIDDIAFELYEIGESDRLAIEAMLKKDKAEDEKETEDNEEKSNDLTNTEAAGPTLVSALLDYTLGAALGRWDIRYATGERQPPELPDPFDPLPVCPPGMLQGNDGLPLSEAEFRRQYAEGRGQKAEGSGEENSAYRPLPTAFSIEQEACEILKVKSLRDYFRTPGQFFASHLARYSKSRRKAPIYWPISTASGDYTLWLYYHRLDDQTLIRCVNRIKAKLEDVARERNNLDNEPNRSAQQDTALKKLSNFEEELRALQKSLEEISKYWKPNLNDGVQITAAPLWEHFRYKPWQKVLKDTWKQLQRGDYNWAHLAHSIWPEKVVPKCAEDRSLAIAHGHESRLWRQVEVEKGKGKKKKKALEWRPVSNAEEVVDEIIEELKQKP